MNQSVEEPPFLSSEQPPQSDRLARRRRHRSSSSSPRANRHKRARQGEDDNILNTETGSSSTDNVVLQDPQVTETKDSDNSDSLNSSRNSENSENSNDSNDSNGSDGSGDSVYQDSRDSLGTQDGHNTPELGGMPDDVREHLLSMLNDDPALFHHYRRRFPNNALLRHARALNDQLGGSSDEDETSEEAGVSSDLIRDSRTSSPSHNSHNDYDDDNDHGDYLFRPVVSRHRHQESGSNLSSVNTESNEAERSEFPGQSILDRIHAQLDEYDRHPNRVRRDRAGNVYLADNSSDEDFDGDIYEYRNSLSNQSSSTRPETSQRSEQTDDGDDSDNLQDEGILGRFNRLASIDSSLRDTVRSITNRVTQRSDNSSSTERTTNVPFGSQDSPETREPSGTAVMQGTLNALGILGELGSQIADYNNNENTGSNSNPTTHSIHRDSEREENMHTDSQNHTRTYDHPPRNPTENSESESQNASGDHDSDPRHRIVLLSQILLTATSMTATHLVGNDVSQGRLYRGTHARRTEQNENGSTATNGANSTDATDGASASNSSSGSLDTDGNTNDAASNNTQETSDDSSNETFPEFLARLRRQRLGNDSTNPIFGRGGRNFFRFFTFPPTAEGRIPILLVGVRASDRDRSEEEGTGERQEGNNDENSQTSEQGAQTREATAVEEPGLNDITDVPTQAARLRQTLADTIRPGAPSHASQLWVTFVIGGVYAPDHPVFSAPSLLTDNPSYEDLLLVERLLAVEKDPVVSAEALPRAGPVSQVTEQYLQDNERCPICLVDYNLGDDVRKLLCTHSFHQECIDQWLTQSHNSCPMCRSAVCAGESQT